MLIDFEKMQETPFPKFNGGNGVFYAKMRTDALGKIMYGRLEPGSSIGLHRHITSSEIIYVLKGTASFSFDGAKEEVTSGGCHYCPKGHSHSLENNGATDVEFFAVVPEQ